MRPDVWAPRARRVDLVLDGGRRAPLEADGDGWFRGGPELGPGERYGFSLDGGTTLPDPRSRWQPDGVHGLSAVDEPLEHPWGDRAWTGVEVLGGVVYELHVGTFTPAGTFDAAIEHLDHLVELGVRAVELMPVAEAMGDRGWGYDGVDLWAVNRTYGGPAALRRFVDAAHQRGLAVLLDVVYNHLGPEGSYLGRFGPYFTDRHHTPWGPAVNLDGPDAAEVRRFIVDNALHWCRDNHLDGLRIDAAHHLIDDSEVHIVAEITTALAGLAHHGGRRTVVIEREEPEVRPLLPVAEGGWGVDARWADDLHHALHAHLTGERDGYYEPFGRLTHIAVALTDGQVLPGDRLPPDMPSTRWITCSQNHDQVGNRAGGERLEHLVGRERAAAAAALVLLGPGTPMLFQGEEWAATTPFPYFCDTADPDLARAIREGRRAEFAAFGWDPDLVADPLDPASASRATLRWAELEEPGHREVLSWYRALIALRAGAPGLSGGDRSATSVEVHEGTGVLVLRRGATTVAVNLGAVESAVAIGAAEVVLAHGTQRWSGGELRLGAGATAVLRSPDGPG